MGEQVEVYNRSSRWRKRGIAMTPVKYVLDRSFYRSLSKVCIYGDGTVLIAIGGVELGQGMFTKVTQAAARTLGAPMDLIGMADTETSKAPNNGCAGGSGTSECMTEATRRACVKLRELLKPYLPSQGGGSGFRGEVTEKQENAALFKAADWKSAAAAAVNAGVCMSAEGWFVDTPTGNTNPYATYGVACSEVEVDALTGE